MTTKASTIDEYIAKFQPDVQKKLQEVRTTIRNAAPDAVETISYAIPTFKLNGVSIIHFAGYAHHIGLYATPDGHVEFETELSKYQRGKGSVQFPHDQPLPLDLIDRITRFRVSQQNIGDK